MCKEELQDKLHKKGLHDLMMNQIYTAVLGSIVYMFFDWVYYIILNYKTINNANEVVTKTFLLLLLIAFYISDFYYIKWTKQYKVFHFIFDLIFLFCMLFSIKFINIDTNNPSINGLDNINFYYLKISYFIFFVLYLIWDIIEHNDAIEEKSTEKDYYKEVITWEIISIILLIISFFIKNQNFTIVTLTLSTIWFCFIAVHKKVHKPSRFFNKILNMIK